MEHEFLVSINELSSSDLATRRKAAVKLGKMEKVEATGLLLSKLTDDNESFRKIIIRALKQIGDTRVIIPLLWYFENESSAKVRALIAWTLGHFIYDEFDLDCLIKSLDEDNTYLKSKIIFALGNKKYTKSVPKLIKLTKQTEKIEIRRLAIWALGEIQDKRALKPLIELLNDPNYKIRKKAAVVLGRFPYTKTKINEILEILEDKKHPGRLNALYIVSKIKNYNSIPILKSIVRSNEHPDTRVKALKIIANFKDTNFLNFMIEMTKDSHPGIEAAAMNALCSYGNKNLVHKMPIKQFIDELNNSDIRVRKSAFAFVRKIRFADNFEINWEEIVQKLNDLLINDPNERFRENLAWYYRTEFIEYESTNRTLELATQDESPRVRKIVYLGLILRGKEVNVKKLLSEINNPSEKVRYHMETPFFRLNLTDDTISNEILDYCLEKLSDAKYYGRESIIYGLRYVKNNPALNTILLNIAKFERNEKVQLAAIRTLSNKNDSQVKEFLLEALNDKSPSIRFHAGLIIRNKYPTIDFDMPDVPEDAPKYIRIEMKPKRRKQKLILPNEIKNNKIELLNILRKNKNYIIRMRAVKALEKFIQQEEVLFALIKALKDPALGVRKIAAFILARTKDPRKIKPLIKSLNDPSPKLRKIVGLNLYIHRYAISYSNSKDIISKEKAFLDIIKNKNHLGRINAIAILSLMHRLKHEPLFTKVYKTETDYNTRQTVYYALSWIQQLKKRGYFEKRCK